LAWQPPRAFKLEIDLNQATYQAFLNCINSFQGLETESEMRGGGGVTKSFMTSKVSMERFVYNLGVLAGLTSQDNLIKDLELGAPFEHWSKIVKHLKETDFFKTPKQDMGHL
jgi:hypothetical protein